MNQPPAVTVAPAGAVRVADRAAAWRWPLVRVVVVAALLAVLGISVGAGAGAAGGAENGTPVSAPVDPGVSGQSEETEGNASPSGRGRDVVRTPAAPASGSGPRAVAAAPYREGRPSPPPLGVRCVVLRC
ncbi:hypothetical protein ACWEFL_19490 [Streptomyces sp. NPDC004838]